MAKKKILGNDYIIEGETTKIISTNLQGEKFEILIDTEDLPKVLDLKYSWSASWRKKIQNYYAVASVYQGDGKNNKTIYLHRIIMDAKDGDYVDHRECNRTLDNRKINLRISKFADNTRNRKGANKNNTTGVRNVNWIESTNEYWVQIMKDGERYKQSFSSTQFEQACKFAKEKREELFGEYAGGS